VSQNEAVRRGPLHHVELYGFEVELVAGPDDHSPAPPELGNTRGHDG